MNLKRLVKDLSSIIINRFKDKGLISLYLAGTILTKDRVFNSDIDFFGFVTKDFDILNEEKEINEFLKKNKQKLCKGIECRLRTIGLDEFSGKIRGNLTKYMGIKELALIFPFWKHIFGKKIGLDKIVKPDTLSKRKHKIILKLRDTINSINKGIFYHIQNISKQVIRLSEIESEITLKKPYTYYYTETEKRFKANKEHIVHKAMQLRRKKVTKKNIRDFMPEIEEYIGYMEKI